VPTAQICGVECVEMVVLEIPQKHGTQSADAHHPANPWAGIPQERSPRRIRPHGEQCPDWKKHHRNFRERTKKAEEGASDPVDAVSRQGPLKCPQAAAPEKNLGGVVGRNHSSHRQQGSRVGQDQGPARRSMVGRIAHEEKKEKEAADRVKDRAQSDREQRVAENRGAKAQAPRNSGTLVEVPIVQVPAPTPVISLVVRQTYPRSDPQLDNRRNQDQKQRNEEGSRGGCRRNEGATRRNRHDAIPGIPLVPGSGCLTLFWAGWYHPAVPEVPLEPRFVEQLVDLVERHGLSEIEWEDGEQRVVVRAAPCGIAHAPAAEGSGLRTPTGSGPEAPGKVLEAPIMGVFYRSPAPGEPPFVDVGDSVQAGQPVGMIEAMKVFSEVLAEQGGRVLRIVAENGTLVQPGDPLFELEAD